MYIIFNVDSLVLVYLVDNSYYLWIGVILKNKICLFVGYVSKYVKDVF